RVLVRCRLWTAASGKQTKQYHAAKCRISENSGHSFFSLLSCSIASPAAGGQRRAAWLQLPCRPTVIAYYVWPMVSLYTCSFSARRISGGCMLVFGLPYRRIIMALSAAAAGLLAACSDESATQDMSGMKVPVSVVTVEPTPTEIYTQLPG